MMPNIYGDCFNCKRYNIKRDDCGYDPCYNQLGGPPTQWEKAEFNWKEIWPRWKKKHLILNIDIFEIIVGCLAIIFVLFIFWFIIS